MVGCPFKSDAILALFEFLGNQFNSEVEITSGLICYCLPVFPQLYRRRIEKIFSAPNAFHTYSHRNVFPRHDSYERHFDSLEGGQDLKPFQSGQLPVFKTHQTDLPRI